MRHVLALVTDAFGGRGGIARYNRDLLSAMARSPSVDKITVLPRLCPDPAGTLPTKITQNSAIFNVPGYVAASTWQALSAPKPSVIFCGHILMSPLAAALAKTLRIPMWLQIHGIDAWSSQNKSVKWGAESSTLVTSVSRYTKSRFEQWWNGDPVRVRVLPNTVGEQFSPGAKPAELIDRYRLHGRHVILTVSRLSYADRYKRIDEVISSLSDVCAVVPDLAYLIVGDGDDAARLKRHAQSEGVSDNVVFAGYVSEAELPDHFRMADVYAMPSSKEGFGIVFLEAARSGLAVIGGNVDGSVDALADGKIGRLINPASKDELVSALMDALRGRIPINPEEAKRFAYENFATHVDQLVRSIDH
jgi:phosphatidylinositol alpha-1,6-mannosyltransferase